MSKQIVSAALVVTCAVALPKTAEAVSFDIFLIADHQAPTSATGPLSLTTNRVFQLSNLNSNFLATQVQEVTGFGVLDVDQALSFASLNDPASGPSSGAPNQPWRTDQGENGASATGSGATETYVNSEISTWDNSGISGTTVDADEQVDLGRGSRLTFNSVVGGFTDLVLADLGGLNNFNLSLCPDAICSTVSQIFGGIRGSVRDTLVATGLFATSDTGVESNQDQTWVFRFHDDPVTDFVSLFEDDNRSIYTGARMQADFVGVAGVAGTPSPVPLPTGLPLLASGFMALGWVMRRKKR